MQKIKKVHLRVNGLLLTVIDINNFHHVRHILLFFQSFFILHLQSRYQLEI